MASVFFDNHDISFTQRYNRELRVLSKKEKEVCAYLMEHSKDVVHMAISELAERCNTSEPSLVRLAQKLGYKGYQAMKISIAQEAIDTTQQIYESLAPTDTISTIVDKVFNSNIKALQDSLKIVNKEGIEAAIEAIIISKHLVFYGVGGSNIIALDGQHKFLRIGFLPLAFSDSNVQLMSAVTLGPGDVVIAISHSGASEATIEMVDFASRAGAKIITITDYNRCPILKFSDIQLFTSSPETAFKPEALSSRIAELSIIDSLFIGTVMKRYKESFGYMKKTRSALDSKKI
jgi:DNA-binding MurR/RpiR family transcriptional regulator